MVIDASVVVKILTRETGWEKAEKLLTENECLVPELLYLEVANALVTKSEYSREQISRGVSLLYLLDLKTEKASAEIVSECADLAKKSSVTVYDMIYAVLAKNLKTSLITADKRFVTKVKMDWVQFFS